jgi:hypothetical protein
VGDRAVPAALVIAGICAGVGVLGITGAAVWAGIWGLGTPRDRAAANQMLRLTAVLLGGRFRDRREYPWYRRPAQYGAVEGELGELGELEYELQIRAPRGRALAGGAPGLRVFTPERVWHWPNLADPGTLAGYVRQAVATAASGELPLDASGAD